MAGGPAWHAAWAPALALLAACRPAAGEPFLAAAGSGSARALPRHSARRLQDDEGHNCENGAKFWDKGWSSGGADQEWCCQHKGIGCGRGEGSGGDAAPRQEAAPARPPDDEKTTSPPATPAPPGTTAQWSFNCHHFLLQWQFAWSKAKQEYCCSHESLGCPSTSTTTTWTTTTVTSTSTSTTRTTSTNTTSTATTTTTTSSYQYACHEDMLDWETSWSEEKASWCCLNEGIACTTTSTTLTTTTTTVTRTITTSTSTSSTITITLTTTTTSTSSTTTSSYEYDCNEGLANWEEGWSELKKSWCCYHQEIGCTTTSTTVTRTTTTRTQTTSTSTQTITLTNTTTITTSTRTTTTTPLYECMVDLEEWRFRWSAYKQKWCCEMQQLGCAPTSTTTTTTKPDCWRSQPGEEVDWPLSKKEWCCEHENVACTTTTSTVTSTITTTQTDTNTTTTTTTETRTLTNTTTTTTSSYEYACDRGLSNWMDEWDEAKMSWCCRHQQVGCTTNTTTATSTTTTATPTTTTRTVTTTTTTTSATTTSTTSTGTITTTTVTVTTTTTSTSSTTTTLPAFDCQIGFEDLEDSWSDRKKDWCCNHGHVQCPAEVLLALAPALTGQPYKCHKGTPKPNMTWDWETGWVLAGDTRTYECDQDLEKWATAWSDSKKEYCCKEELKWCPKGFRRELGWTDAKTEWCCNNENLGCEFTTSPGPTTSAPGPTPPPATTEGALGAAAFDCQEDVSSWQTSWSEDKMVWCCQNEQLGCPGSEGAGPPSPEQGQAPGAEADAGGGEDLPIIITQSYDCSAERDSWDSVWSEDKKEWCCKHESVGCAPPGVDVIGDWDQRPRPSERAPAAPTALGLGALAAAASVAGAAALGLGALRRRGRGGAGAYDSVMDPSRIDLLEAPCSE